MNLTFADLLTPPGVVAAAALTTSLVALLKGVFPAFDARISGALAAFVITALLYVLTAVAVGIGDLNGAFLVFLAWLSAATSATGIHSTAQHVADQRVDTP